jgi:hypothetical protein
MPMALPRRIRSVRLRLVTGCCHPVLVSRGTSVTNGAGSTELEPIQNRLVVHVSPEECRWVKARWFELIVRCSTTHGTVTLGLQGGVREDLGPAFAFGDQSRLPG